MGASFTNLQVRNAATAAVCAELPKLTPSRAYVSPACHGWVTVYTEVTEDQDKRKLCTLAAGLAKALQTEVLAFLVHDSSVARYWLYRGGELADAFNSAPGYFDESVSQEARERVRGRVEALLPLGLSGSTAEALDAVLHPPGGPPTFAEEIVGDLARLLGMDEARASLGFEYFTNEGEQLLPDAGDFEPLGQGTARLKSQEPQPDELAEVLGENLIPLPGDTAAAPEPAGDLTTAGPVPDMYPVALSMLTQPWGAQHQEAVAVYAQMSGLDRETVAARMVQGADLAARDLLKKSTVPGLPSSEALIGARNQGPEALAELVAVKTPGQLADLGVVAAAHGLTEFVGALLKRGLDPNASNAQGVTTLRAAEAHGPDSAVYRVVKAAAG